MGAFYPHEWEQRPEGTSVWVRKWTKVCITVSEEPRRKTRCSQKEKKPRDEARNVCQPKSHTNLEFKK